MDLELAVNRLSILPENIFDLPNLQLISLVQNDLRSLDAAIFGRSLDSLVFIDAGINRINAVDPGMIREDSNIRSLDLVFNACIDADFIDIPQFRDEILTALQLCIDRYESIELNCEYAITEDDFYRCQLSVDNEEDRLRFESISGNHLTGRNNDDVTDVVGKRLKVKNY